jgi:ribonuclease P protein component
MKQFYRLTQSSEILRVRRLGKSNAHPLVVLSALKKEGQQHCRITVVAGKGVGGAVQRNRAKRRIRAVMQALYPFCRSEFDVVIVARKNVVDASFEQLTLALKEACQKTGLVQREDVRV